MCVTHQFLYIGIWLSTRLKAWHNLQTLSFKHFSVLMATLSCHMIVIKRVKLFVLQLKTVCAVSNISDWLEWKYNIHLTVYLLFMCIV